METHYLTTRVIISAQLVGTLDENEGYVALTESQNKRALRKIRFAGMQSAREANEIRDEIMGHQSQFNSRPIRQIGNANAYATRADKLRTGPTPEELHWRESVLVRDGYKCVKCGATEQLEADHIKPKFLYPDLKYEVSNGQTLCRPCHVQTETYGSKVRRLAKVSVEESG